jgi:hypothetical protein
MVSAKRDRTLTVSSDFPMVRKLVKIATSRGREQNLLIRHAACSIEVYIKNYFGVQHFQTGTSLDVRHFDLSSLILRER